MTVKRLKTQPIILYFDAQHPLLRYGLAVLAVAAAAIVTRTIPVIGERAAFLLFFFAIIQSSFWLGRNPGILAMILSFIAVNTLVLLPAWISAPHNTLILNSGFCILSAVIITTTGLHRNLTAALWESRQDLDHAQAVGQIGSWRLNVLRNELRWSDENHRIFGIPKGTPLTYETFLSTVHPEDREYVDRMWQAGLRGDPYDIEHRLIVAGKVKWVRERAELEFDKKGILLGGFGTTQDITGRKNSELALAESRQRYAGIIESAMDAIITIDADQRILVFNAAAEIMFGCTADEAIGGSLKRFIPERFRQAHGSNTRAFGLVGTTSRKMGKLSAIAGLRANGEEFPIEASISQAGIDSGKSFTAILRDVTERKRTEFALKEQLRLQNQLSKVAATVPGVICSFRLRPDGSSSMPYASPIFESVTGLSPDVVAEDFSPFFARIHPGDIGHVKDTTNESARSLQPWRGTFRYNHPTKGEIWIESHSMPQHEMDGSILWHGYIQDVTERKLAEAALRDRESELRLIMDATPALISYLDTDFRYLRVNKTYENWFCVTLESILGHVAREIIGDKAWNIVRPYLERARAGERISFDQVIPYGTGKPRWVHETYIPDKDSNGNIKGIVVHIVDIEDRKKAELERQKFVSLADNSQEFIGMCDMSFLLFYVNAAGMQLVGIDSLEQALLTPVQDFFFPEDQRFIIEEFFPRVMRERRGEVEVRFRHFQTGAALSMLYNVFYITNENGEPVGLATVSRDITARKLVESALQESEEQLRQAKNAAALGIYDHDLVSGKMQWDERVREIWGVKPDETITLAIFLERVYPEDRASIKDAVGRSFDPQGSGEYYAEYRVINPIDNRLYWVAVFGTTTFANGRPIRLVGFVQDITERKRTEAALEESERQNRFLANILENSNQPFGTGFPDGRLEYVNPAFERLTGYSRDELLAMDWATELTPSEWKETEQAKLEELQRTHHAVRYEKEYFRKDGTRVPIELLVELETTDASQPIRYYAFLTDLTERKQAEAALRVSEARLALVVEEVKAGYWDWDLMTNAVYLSPEWKRQIGFDENELLNRWEQWESRLHPDDWALVLAATENYIAGGQPVFELEFRLRHKDGSYRWIHSRGGLLRDQNNHTYRMLGINLDITDYKKTRELSERRDKMEQSFRLYVASQTAAAIAHELNQPLAAISSYADVALLMLQNGNQTPQKLTHVLENCALQAQRAGDVIRQLMTVLHKGEAISEPIDINTSVREALDLVKADLDLGSFKIEPDLAAGLPLVSANGLQIQKVLVNLLRNGLESMQESGLNAGTMAITTRSSAVDPAMAQVTVCDSGKGVADTATLKTMFQPFHTTKATGLGMGLGISRALIEAYGGKMWAEQNTGMGISVHFTLPFVI